MSEALMIWFAQVVAHSLWVGLAIGAAGWALLRCYRKSPARQHAILCGALLLLMLCVPVTVGLCAPDFSEIRPASAPARMEPFGVELTSASGTGGESESRDLTWSGAEPRRGTPALAGPAGPRETVLDWSAAAPWVVAGYVLGLLVMLVRLSLACGGSHKLRRRATPVEEDRWRESLRRLMRRLELKTEPALAWSSEVATPVLVGILKPMILLPVALATRLSTEQAEAVLTHELAHLRRHDQWILLAQRVLETVLFYHPVVWWLSAQLSKTREQACDDVVLASGAQPADYAEALVLCSELRLTGAGLAEDAALQLAATGHKGTSLRQRVMRVLGQEDPIRPGKAGWMLASLFVLTIILTGVGLVTPVEAQNPEGRKEEPVAEEKAIEPAEDLPVAEPKSVSIWDDPAISDVAKDRLYKRVASNGHVVKAGDTLATISGRYGVSEKSLRTLNPGIEKGLEVGQKVVIYGAQLQVEFVIAEVPALYKVQEHWMTKEMLENRKDVQVVSRPSVVTRSGVECTISTGAVQGGPNRKEKAIFWRSGYSLTLTPTLRGEQAECSLMIQPSLAEKRVVTKELEAALGTWTPFTILPPKAGKKLVGTMRISRGDVGRAGFDPKVFQLLRGGRVRWMSEIHEVNRLMLPERGEGAVIKAAKDLPYQDVVRFLEILKPVYGNAVSFAVEDEESQGAKAVPVPGGQERLAEIESQLVKCYVELDRLKAEIGELTGVLEDHDPKLRSKKNRLETARAFIKDLEEAREELLVEAGDAESSWLSTHRREGGPPADPVPHESLPAEDDPARVENVPAEDEVSEESAPEEDSSRGVEDAPDEGSVSTLPTGKWKNAASPETREAWYNALPQRLGAEAGEDPAKIREISNRDSYPLYYPGAPYPNVHTSKPYFAIGMNRRLMRKDDGADSQKRDAVIFFERGLPGVQSGKAKTGEGGWLPLKEGDLDPRVFDSEMAWQAAARRELSRLEAKLKAERQLWEQLVELESKGEQLSTKAVELEPRVRELEREVENLRKAIAQREAKPEKKAADP